MLLSSRWSTVAGSVGRPYLTPLSIRARSFAESAAPRDWGGPARRHSERKSGLPEYGFRGDIDKEWRNVNASSHRSGLRFPTLETSENYDYWKDRGLDRVTITRSYPIKVPAHRRMSPYLREYIHFLHNLDPARFTVDRIAERYRMKSATVERIIQEWSANRYLTQSGLVNKLSDKQTTKEKVILQKKEMTYARWAGWDQMGEEDDIESDSEDSLEKFRGWRSTSDWVRRQSVEVEAMSAFPMMEKRDPMPKRVDVDMQVGSSRDFKVINWIDPLDKVVF